jgi:hypothetical protein
VNSFIPGISPQCNSLIPEISEISPVRDSLIHGISPIRNSCIPEISPIRDPQNYWISANIRYYVFQHVPCSTADVTEFD